MNTTENLTSFKAFMAAGHSVANIDYTASAGLYPCKTNKRTTRVRYRRFDSVAEAVRFAIEDMPDVQLRGCVLEVDEVRFDGNGIRKLYDAQDYPLLRRA